MIKRETVVSLLAGFLVGACGIFPAVAGSGFDFGPAQGGGGGGLSAVSLTGDALSGAGTSASPLAAAADLENLVDTAAVDASGNVTLAAGATLDASSTGIVKIGAGSASAAALRIAGDANTGIYGTADTSIGMAIGGTERLGISTTGVTLGAGYTLTASSGVAFFGIYSASSAGAASGVAYRINADVDTGLFGTANGNVSVAVAGAQIASVGTTGVTRRIYPEAATGNYTLANAQSDQVFTNTGAGGAIEVELGSVTVTGFATTWVATDNQDVTLDPGSSDKFVGLAGGWADGEAMILDDQNDAVRIVRLSTGDWLVEWTRGTLTEETP